MRFNADKPMKKFTEKVAVAIKRILRDEDHDLVEYVLVVALFASGATAAMPGLASNINTAFTVIAESITCNFT